MPAPLLNPASFITATPLDDFSLRYANAQENYMALKIFAPHVVARKTGQYYSYSKSNLKQKTVDAPSGTEAATHGYSVSKRTYTTAEKAIKSLVLGKDARDFDRPVADLDQEAAMQNMDALLLELEITAATLVELTTNYPASLVTTLVDGSNRWSDAGGDPMQQIRDLSDAIFLTSLKRPNALAMDMASFHALELNAQVVDRVKYTSREVSQAIIASLLGLQELIIADVGKNTARDGAADSVSRVWSDKALLFVKDPAARLKGMVYGKAFVANNMYTKTIDKPELGRDAGAHELETGWEYVLAPGGTVSSSDDDFVAGGLIVNTY